jgi:hypothetical protein
MKKDILDDVRLLKEREGYKMIRRLQPGYHPIGVLHSNEDRPKIRYCQRCEDMFGVSARLGPRIMPLDVASGKPIPKPHDYDLWLECRNCGTLYQKYETKVEPELEPIKQPSTGPKGKVQKVEKKPKQRIGRGQNPRWKASKWEIKDEDLQRELKDGAQLISYSSSDPLS